jgi:hypothetical protein
LKIGRYPCTDISGHFNILSNIQSTPTIGGVTGKKEENIFEFESGHHRKSHQNLTTPIPRQRANPLGKRR